LGIRKALTDFLNTLPYVRGLYSQVENLKRNSRYPPGHFYSPIVSVKEIMNREHKIWKENEKDSIPGIDLHSGEQMELLKALSEFYPELPFKKEKQPNLRYQLENGYYNYTDGIILYSMIRHFKPKRIIEIGSGHSSAVMMDTNDLYFNKAIELCFIEPYPDRLFSLLSESDKNRVIIIQTDVQSVSLEKFESLEAGDILFVDSTHVSKTGSDVNYILFDILPVLKKGVLIHFHDVFYPFEYPKEWVFDGYNWNEDYILKAFLMYNDKFKIRLFSEYMHRFHEEGFAKMPLSRNDFGGNLWIEKL
jgi:predicted O-methyltransferase YrrM